MMVDSGATVAGGVLRDIFMLRDRLPVPRGTFQIVRRASLEQFNAEIEQARAAAADQQQAAERLTSKAGVYVLRGSFDESDIDGARQLTLRVALVHAESGDEVGRFELTQLEGELDESLAAAIDSLAASLVKKAGLPAPEETKGPDKTQFVALRSGNG